MLSAREKFLFLLQTEYTCILKALGSFVYRAFKLHHYYDYDITIFMYWLLLLLLLLLL